MPRKRKSSAAPIEAGSQRRPDILRYCEQHIKSLVKLYETTDPVRGEASERGKLEAARQAISIWWYLWGELLLWAQSHLAGYEMLKSHPELRERLEKRLGASLTVDSHAVEYVGVYFSWNHVDDSDPMLTAIHQIMEEEFEITMSDPPLRPIIRELLVSRSANSSFLRFPLGHAMFALELGDVDELVTPRLRLHLYESERRCMNLLTADIRGCCAHRRVRRWSRGLYVAGCFLDDSLRLVGPDEPLLNASRIPSSSSNCSK